MLSTYIYEKAIGFGPDAFPLAAALSVLLSVIAVGGTLMETALVGKNGKSESIKEDYSVRIELEGTKTEAIRMGAVGNIRCIKSGSHSGNDKKRIFKNIWPENDVG